LFFFLIIKLHIIRALDLINIFLAPLGLNRFRKLLIFFNLAGIFNDFTFPYWLNSLNFVDFNKLFIDRYTSYFIYNLRSNSNIFNDFRNDFLTVSSFNIVRD